MSVHIKLIFVVDYFCYILKTIRICNKNNNVFYLCIGTALGRLSIGTAKMNNWDVSGTGTSHSIGTFLPTKIMRSWDIVKSGDIVKSEDIMRGEDIMRSEVIARSKSDISY